ncbi:MAG: hypothetical protein U0610_30100 [bacterium]
MSDPLPSGEKIYALSHGSLNNQGTAAFYVQTVPGSYSADVYTAANGVLTQQAAVGGLAPGGRVFTNLAREWFGFVDGTEMPLGRRRSAIATSSHTSRRRAAPPSVG